MKCLRRGGDDVVPARVNEAQGARAQREEVAESP